MVDGCDRAIAQNRLFVDGDRREMAGRCSTISPERKLRLWCGRTITSWCAIALGPVFDHRIPELLAGQQVKFGVEVMTQAEYCRALRQKLIEEAREAAEAGETDLVTELADLCEVIDTMLDAYGI